MQVYVNNYYGLKVACFPIPLVNETHTRLSIHLKLFHFQFNTHSNIYILMYLCRCICIWILDLSTAYGTFFGKHFTTVLQLNSSWIPVRKRAGAVTKTALRTIGFSCFRFQQ